MGLQMDGVDRQLLWLASFGDELGQNPLNTPSLLQWMKRL